MAFDIHGRAPKSAIGRFFRTSVWVWRPLQMLITLACAEELSEEEKRALGFNDGYAFSAEKAALIADRLTEIADDEDKLQALRVQVDLTLPPDYAEFWDETTLFEFAEFLQNSGGFEVW